MDVFLLSMELEKQTHHNADRPYMYKVQPDQRDVHL